LECLSMCFDWPVVSRSSRGRSAFGSRRSRYETLLPSSTGRLARRHLRITASLGASDLIHHLTKTQTAGLAYFPTALSGPASNSVYVWIR
jgi:hypothetical protein